MRRSILLALFASTAATGVGPIAPTTTGSKPLSLLLRRALTSVVREPVTTLRWRARLLREGNSPMRIGTDLEIRENDKGRGLYALRTLEEGELVGRYTGKVILEEDWDDYDTSGLYAMGLVNGDMIDGEDEKRSNFVRFINHSVRTRKKNRLHITCYARA